MQVIDKERLRVCHLISSLRYGGAERQLINLLNNLKVGKKYLITMSDESNDGLHRFLNQDIRHCLIKTKLRYCFISIFRMASFLKQNNIDVLQTHMFWANLYGVLAGKLGGVPVIITTEHGKNPWKKGWHRYIERKMITAISDLRVCVSKDILENRSKKEQIPVGKLRFITNAVEVPAEKTGINNAKITIGTIGRFVDAKDYATLIKSAKILKDKQIDFQLFLIGDGPLRAAYQKQVDKLNMASAVTMPGFQSDIDNWLGKFDLFVISSKREGQPLVLLEAMAKGLPIVATRVGGIPETLHDGQEGILVEPGSAEKIAAAIQRLIDDQPLRKKFGRKARERAIKDFSIDALCKKYEETYLDILAKKKIKGAGLRFSADQNGW